MMSWILCDHFKPELFEPYRALWITSVYILVVLQTQVQLLCSFSLVVASRYALPMSATTPPPPPPPTPSPFDGSYSSLSAAQAMATDPLGRFLVFARDTSWKANLKISISFLVQLPGNMFLLLGLDICFPLLGQHLMSQMAHSQCPTLLVNTLSQLQSLDTSQTTHPNHSVTLRKVRS